MNKTFQVYADPGHAWAKVSLEDLAALDLSTEDFSAYSYRRGDHIYLEEDGDLTYFAKVFFEKRGEQPKWRECHSEKSSKIRGYASNQPGQRYRDRVGRLAA